jgi:hypothetical protein
MESDIVVAEQFTRIVGLLDPPTRLLQPKIALRAISRRNRPPIPHQAEPVPTG